MDDEEDDGISTHLEKNDVTSQIPRGNFRWSGVAFPERGWAVRSPVLSAIVVSVNACILVPTCVCTYDRLKVEPSRSENALEENPC